MDPKKDFRAITRMVIKVGTTTLTYPNGKMNLKRMQKLAWVLTDLHSQGKEVVLVSSGAIAVGTDRLGLPERPHDIPGKQAASAVGQAVLMQMYENFFMTYNQKVAQILLTKDVVEDESRKELAKNTFDRLLSMGVIPIVNENDTISKDELEFSDNDTLSAYVACLVEGECLVILTDTDGLYEADPKVTPDAKHISCVDAVTQKIEKLCGGPSSRLGTGGMITKIMAAKMATRFGIDTIIASGNDPTVLFDILDGKSVGTLFAATNANLV